MRNLLVRRQRRMLRGWFRWIPVLAIPFTVLFIHAWLNIQILRADYVLRELDKESKVLQGQLDHAGVVQSVQQDPEILAAQADRLEFVPPKPGQREVISYNPREFTPSPDEEAFAMAQRGAIREAPALRTPMPLPVQDVNRRESAPERVADPPPTVWVALDEHADEVFTAAVEDTVSTSVVLDLPADDEMEVVSDLDTAMDDLEVL